MSLYLKLKLEVLEWEKQNYLCDYPIISTILKYNQNNFLRKAQFEALETYWYLRLVKNTPNIFDLYRSYFPGKTLFEVFGLKHLIENLPEDLITPEFTKGILKKIKTDDSFHAEGLGSPGTEFHHHRRPDSDDAVNFLTAFQPLFQGHGYHAFETTGTVIRRYNQLVADTAQPVLPEEDILTARAKYRYYLVPGLP